MKKLREWTLCTQPADEVIERCTIFLDLSDFDVVIFEDPRHKVFYMRTTLVDYAGWERSEF